MVLIQLHHELLMFGLIYISIKYIVEFSRKQLLIVEISHDFTPIVIELNQT